ncbi:MAG TPA: winged helix-turn-helix domain-containing protein [Vicinamibacteria bacterium]|nr:winged helix-turn-helix domain-containing protein [Vicinamibacteria bacterium]
MPVYRFDDVRVDTAAFRIERGGQAVALEPKAFDLLVLLLERRGEVVTKQEILDSVWRQTAVTDNALTRIVAHLRKGLGDDAREARYVETVPTRGYRFVAPVRTGDGAAPAAEAAAPARRGRGFVLAAVALLVAGAVLSLALRRAPARVPAGIVYGSMWPTQATTSPGLDAFPALAPNGRTLAYASDRTGGFEIVIKSLAAGARETALTADGGQNVQPAWSPDGEHLAYHSMRRGGIWIVPALGGAARRVADFGSKPAWSPDGQRLAFQSDPLADVAPSAYGANIPSTIWTVARDGSLLRRLTSPTHPLGGHAAPAWSPDGRRIAFATYSRAPAGLWSVPAAGGTATRLVEGYSPVFDPVFAPDGTAVYYAPGGPFIVRVPLSAATGRPEGQAAAIATPGLAGVRHLSLSSDGRRMAMASLGLSSNLWSVAVSPRTGEAAGPPRPLTDDTSRRKTTPVFSPDGQWIAYTGSRGGSGSDIWVMSARDGRALPVTDGDPTATRSASPSHFRPSWFPDSARVAFIVSEGGRTMLQAADLTSRRAEPLLDLGAGRAGGVRHALFNALLDHRLSPDATRVAYSEVDPVTGMSRLYVRTLGSGEVQALSPPDHAESYPVWSPDGRWIASERKDEKGTAIAVRPATGGPVRTLAPAPGQSWVHDWGPDLDRVLFAGQRGGVWNVRWVSRTTGRETQVTRYTGVDTFVRYPAWSPRGDRIVFEQGEVRGNIWTSVVPGPGQIAGWTSRSPGLAP